MGKHFCSILSTTYFVVLFGLKVFFVLNISFTIGRDKMALQGKGTIYQHVKGKMYVYIPANIRDDSQFPFKPGDRVSVRIEKNKLIVEK